MKKMPCLYAIVRFTPFVETGEFANVGIIMMAPEQRCFEYKLMIQRHARVTHFFEQLDAKVFRATMRNLREELNRAAGVLRRHGFDKRLKSNDVDFAKGLFAEIIRPRETIIKFSEPRAILAEDMKATLTELYGHYVERSFATRGYQETALERGMRRWLNQARIADRFEHLALGDDGYHVTFPFVERRGERAVKAIKPLHLGHDQPTKIIEHGWQWVTRVTQLHKRRYLPDTVLFAVQGPEEDGPKARAYGEVVQGLRETGVTVLPFKDKEHILAFAVGSA
ncbi:DUF3037 domain-containing protein [Methylococcus mesophilus]|uniref:DUF3037 domain-containing protein n=1 Tax=Methylococcus mesophilus TaxID=2993564 RepID=UPI00224A7CCF|nr:DUF3037 domain-containing protein [Methylococcus mesophilus]UZR30945.1 DUF3037 domain-containing protein [Methylococcus mesophilus]